MTNFLEAAMLICFGLSWPLSLYKNIKAKSANKLQAHNLYCCLLF